MRPVGLYRVACELQKFETFNCQLGCESHCFYNFHCVFSGNPFTIPRLIDNCKASRSLEVTIYRHLSVEASSPRRVPSLLSWEHRRSAIWWPIYDTWHRTFRSLPGSLRQTRDAMRQGLGVSTCARGGSNNYAVINTAVTWACIWESISSNTVRVVSQLSACMRAMYP